MIGREARGPALAYPGRVIRDVRPKPDGKAGHASISFTGFDANRAQRDRRLLDRNGERGEKRLDIPKIAVEPPPPLLHASGPGRMDSSARHPFEGGYRRGRAREARKGATAEQVDERILSAAQVRAVVENFNRLRAAACTAMLWRTTIYVRFGSCGPESRSIQSGLTP